MSGLSASEVQALLEGAVPGVWEARHSVNDGWAVIWTSYGHYTLAERVHPRSAPLLAAAPALARRVLELEAEVDRLRAQAAAVAGLADRWKERAQDLEKRVPMPMVDDRDAHMLGRSGGLESCAKDLLTLLTAQASAGQGDQEAGG